MQVEHKYESVQNYIKVSIQKGQLLPGEKAPSENALAAQFKVSRQTARHALTALVQAGLLERKQGKGTFVKARQLNIGICMTYLDTYIFPDIIRGIESELRKRQMTFVLTNSNNEPQQEYEAIRLLIDQGIDGLIFEPARSALRTAEDPVFDLLLKSKTQTILINSPVNLDFCGFVVLDDMAGMQDLVDHLYNLGHRRFAGLFCHDLIQGRMRYEGFMRSLANREIDRSQIEVGWFDSRDLSNNFTEKATHYLQTWLEQHITAICFYNDQIADLCLDLLDDLKVAVPDDLSVTGFDAVRQMRSARQATTMQPRALLSRQQWPALTSERHPGAGLGAHAVELLGDLIQGNIAYPDARVILRPSFVQGTSTGAYKEHALEFDER